MPDWRRLSEDPDFQGLFAEGPLANELAVAEARILDPGTPAEVRQELSWWRKGVLAARDTPRLKLAAEAEDAERALPVDRPNPARFQLPSFLRWSTR